MKFCRMDLTQKRGFNSINSIAVSLNLMKYVEGCKLLEINEVIATDYRSYIIDINFEEYFQENLTNWDNINKTMLNSSRKSHREQFKERLEELIVLYHLER